MWPLAGCGCYCLYAKLLLGSSMGSVDEPCSMR